VPALFKASVKTQEINMKQFITAIISSILLTIIFLLLLINFQVDIASLFGLSQNAPSAISLLKDFASPLAASFGGAVAGAFVAFRLQNKKEERKERETELSSLNLTILALESQLNDLFSIKKTSILPACAEPLRFNGIQPLAVVEHVSERVDMRFASALIKLKKGSLIQEIRIAERRYLNVINTLRRRDSVKERIDNMTLAAGIDTFDEYSLADLYKIIGPNNLALLYKMTEDYIYLLDDAISSLWKAIKEIEAVSKENYKGLGKLSFDIPDDNKAIISPTPKPIIKNEKELLFLAGHKTK
jgi:hypothetical protein